MSPRISAACVLLAGLALAAQAQTVGLLSMVSGSVELVRAGQRTPVSARTADLVGAGDRVMTGENSRASFLFCPASQVGVIPPASDVQFLATSIEVRKGKLT